MTEYKERPLCRLLIEANLRNDLFRSLEDIAFWNSGDHHHNEALLREYDEPDCLRLDESYYSGNIEFYSRLFPNRIKIIDKVQLLIREFKSQYRKKYWKKKELSQIRWNPQRGFHRHGIFYSEGIVKQARKMLMEKERLKTNEYR